MEKRFQGLQLIGKILRVIGGMELVLAGIGLIIIPLVSSDALLMQLGFLYLPPGSGLIAGILLGLIIFIGGLAAGLFTFASGELFNLLIAIEENTRTATRLLKDQG